MYHTAYHTPAGNLHLIADDNQLLQITPAYTPAENMLDQPNKILDQAANELDAYFAGALKTFTVPHKTPQSDTFRHKSQQALTTIPYGQTRTYGQIAAQVGNQGATRAVGSACATNTMLIIIPCHRVIRNDGSLGQYAGGVAMKKYLLDLEKA